MLKQISANDEGSNWHWTVAILWVINQELNLQISINAQEKLGEKWY